MPIVSVSCGSCTCLEDTPAVAAPRTTLGRLTTLTYSRRKIPMKVWELSLFSHAPWMWSVTSALRYAAWWANDATH